MRCRAGCVLVGHQHAGAGLVVDRWSPQPPLKVLLVDETSMRRHRYVTVIERRLAMIPAVTGFLVAGCQSRRHRRSTLRGHLFVLDRFHASEVLGAHPVRRDSDPKAPNPRSIPKCSGRYTRGDTLTNAGPASTHPPEAAGRLASTPRAADDHDGALEALDRFGPLPNRRTARVVGQTKSSPGTTPTTPATAESKEQIISSKRRTAHGFTNPTNFQARGLLVECQPPNPTFTSYGS